MEKNHTATLVTLRRDEPFTSYLLIDRGVVSIQYVVHSRVGPDARAMLALCGASMGASFRRCVSPRSLVRGNAGMRCGSGPCPCDSFPFGPSGPRRTLSKQQRNNRTPARKTRPSPHTNTKQNETKPETSEADQTGHRRNQPKNRKTAFATCHLHASPVHLRLGACKAQPMSAAQTAHETAIRPTAHALRMRIKRELTLSQKMLATSEVRRAGSLKAESRFSDFAGGADRTGFVVHSLLGFGTAAMGAS